MSLDIKDKGAVSFLTKKQREELALQRLEEKRKEMERKEMEMKKAHDDFISGKNIEEKRKQEIIKKENEEKEKLRRLQEEKKERSELDHEVKAIRDHYIGNPLNKRRKIIKPTEKFQKLFQFDWEVDDDTTKDDYNPLYQNRVKINALFGRGYIAGIDQREQRKDSNFLLSLSEKRLQLNNANDNDISEQEKKQRLKIQNKITEDIILRSRNDYSKDNNKHWSEKSLDEMTDRDWRIFREDFDIRIQGGKATLPLRYWNEAKLDPTIMKAIEAVGYKTPSPIQRQAIPVGLSGRDIIGIAETGSGKTAAFLIPMLAYMIKLPAHYISRCNEQGPLAVVMAPTRELAQQIEAECQKLAKYTAFRSCCVVGGQDIEDQGYQLRRGVEICIGTPGRMVDCIENNYLVLNQCNYVVLDEADRMVDMGFEPQVIAVLDAMGGLLKSEDEAQAEQQMQTISKLISSTDNTVIATEPTIYRVTAMFSATMPAEVERIAKTYLRHPVMIRIGDEDTGKNKRIEQIVLFLSSDNQKKSKLIEELNHLNLKVSTSNSGSSSSSSSSSNSNKSNQNKVIVFINAKKNCDIIGKYLETLGYPVGVLHGGKSQDQREETLENFRKNRILVLVASDVAARGLDISDVTHVYNYDLPNKIENYTHRIGRTGRAGKSGVATSFLTDSDTDIMYDLKNYLEATNMPVPPQLVKHPAAQAPVGSRDDKGKLIGTKKDSIQYSKK